MIARRGKDCSDFLALRSLNSEPTFVRKNSCSILQTFQSIVTKVKTKGTCLEL